MGLCADPVLHLIYSNTEQEKIEIAVKAFLNTEESFCEQVAGME